MRQLTADPSHVENQKLEKEAGELNSLRETRINLLSYQVNRDPVGEINTVK